MAKVGSIYLGLEHLLAGKHLLYDSVGPDALEHFQSLVKQAHAPLPITKIVPCQVHLAPLQKRPGLEVGEGVLSVMFTSSQAYYTIVFLNPHLMPF